MTDNLILTGVVLSATPVGEYDRLLVLLTKERGRITAFAKGARRPNSALRAVACQFVCASFELYEGRSSYTLKSAEVISYFTELQSDLNALCYGSYFTELADYFAKENLVAADMLNLLYVSFKALQKKQIPADLIRYIFELKLMVIEGEYTELPPVPCNPTAVYAWEYVIKTPLNKLYTFNLKEDSRIEFSHAVTVLKRRIIDRSFHSLEILESMEGLF